LQYRDTGRRGKLNRLGDPVVLRLAPADVQHHRRDARAQGFHHRVAPGDELRGLALGRVSWAHLSGRSRPLTLKGATPLAAGPGARLALLRQTAARAGAT